MNPFALSSVVHLVRPTGRVARDLDELARGLAEADEATLFHHAPLTRMRGGGGDEFSAWVRGVVQDPETAERLAFAVQDAAPGAAALRDALTAVLDTLPPAARGARTAPPDGGFAFLAAESVPLATGLAATDPDALVRLLAVTDTSAWFLHLIEEPWLGTASPTLVAWLRASGGDVLAAQLEREVATGLPIDTVRDRVLRVWRRRGLARRVADATRRPEKTRRDHGRAVVAGLARRLARGENP